MSITLDLDSLAVPVAQVRTTSGVLYPVRPLTRRLADLIDGAMNAPDGVARVEGFYNAAAALLPDMPRDEVDDLTVPQVLAIMSLASGTSSEPTQEAAQSEPSAA